MYCFAKPLMDSKSHSNLLYENAKRVCVRACLVWHQMIAICYIYIFFIFE